MKVEKRIVSNGHGWLDADYIVIHETANPGATALNHVSLWSRDDTYAVHYVMDWHGIAYNCVPENRLCWQVGNGNAHVIGIELCHATNWADFRKVWDAAVEWAAWILKKKGWGTGRLLSHYDCTRIWGGSDHTDPIGYFGEFGKTWQQFVNAVAEKLKGVIVRKQDPGKAVNDFGLHYRAHVQKLGWCDPVRDGQTAGTTGNAFRLEAFKLSAPEGWVLEADAHIQDIGWKTWKGIQAGKNSGTGSSPNDPIIGTTGQGKGIQAIEIRATKRPEKDRNKRIWYKVHVAGFGWTGWIKEGYACGTVGIGRNIEAIKIKVV